MMKIENENEIISTDGQFFRLKAPQSLLKSGEIRQYTSYFNSDKLKDYLDVKIKVVSTQLTQNGIF
jgi:hypothetical protein